MVRLTDVSKRFGSIRAVRDLSLTIEAGEIFGLLGPNGAGKTTAISLIVGLLRPTSGAVHIASDPTTRSPARIGLAPQFLAIYEDLTASENLRFFGRLHGLNARELDTRVHEMLRFVELADRARDRAGTFSGGMKRRLNLAASLVHDPEIIFLDEPTVGVDPQSRNALFAMIERLRSLGRTIIYTTHYMEEAQRLCDRVAIIDHGALLALDTVDTLIDRHGGKSVITIETADGERRVETDDPLAELTDILAAGDALGVRVARPDLESVFLNLTGRSLRDP